MNSTQMEQPSHPSNRVKGRAWQPSPSLISSLYFVVFIAAIGLAVGMTGALMRTVDTTAAGDGQDAFRSDPTSMSQRGQPHEQADGQRAEQLKMSYLACARDSSRMQLDDAAVCGDLADVLVAHSFGGDFARMLDWWRTLHEAAQ